MSSEVSFRTQVDIPSWPQPLQVSDRMVFLGSCFAEYIGNRFREYGLDAMVCPVGVLYNPESIRQVILQALHPSPLPLFPHAGEWHCWLTGTLLGGKDMAECRQSVEGAFLMLGQALREADHVFLTLGTNVSYRLKSNGLTVSNCHKCPQSLFDEHTLDITHCTDALRQIVETLVAENPRVHIHFTVSPYRYAKYGFHRSQLAKATLLLSADTICTERPDICTYFPAYEIVMDELRDYRFYNSDMLHPSSVAVDYIWQRITECCMSPAFREYLTDYEPIRRARMHRPTDAASPQYQAFLQKIAQQETQVRRKYHIEA